MHEDAELLRRYVAYRSESDFTEFVARHVDFVYGSALRRVGGDAHAAEDITQRVFIATARQARTLAAHPMLVGWLFSTTRNVAAEFVRTERRRRQREQEAQAMTTNDSTKGSVDWIRVKSILDEALDELADADREAVLLRFFAAKSYGELGARLRLTENAARMRVDRALTKLNAALLQRGIPSTAAALAIGLAGQVTVAAPAGLATSAATMAFGAGAAAGATTAVFMGFTKVQVAVASVLALAGTTGALVQSRHNAALTRELASVREQAHALSPALAEHAQLIHRRENVQRGVRLASTDLDAVLAENASLSEQVRVAKAQADRQRLAASQQIGTCYDLREVDRQPHLTAGPPPAYPIELLHAGTEGEALVELVVAPTGKVLQAYAVKWTDPAFATAAVAAVEGWKFDPGQKGGTAVATRVQVPIKFTLNTTPTSVASWF